MPILGSRSLWTSAGTTLDPATTAWVAAVVANGGSVSDARKTIVNTLIVGLKADSLWTKLDRLWLFAAENGGSALTDLVGLTLATAVSSPSFTADTGYTGNGSSSYIDTEYDPTNSAVNYAQNDAHMAVWNLTDPGDGVVFGATGTGKTQILLARGSSAYNINTDNQNALVTLSDDEGFMLADRTGSDEFFYQNGAQADTENIASDGLTSDDFFILCRNTAGAPNSFSTNTVAGCSVGAHLTSGEASDFYTRLRTYMTSVGVP